MPFNLSNILKSSPLLMGILNITPDSFSDGGEYLDEHKFIYQLKQHRGQGADIIDIGAESTRPNAKVISLDEEYSRLRNILPNIRKHDNGILSIDSYKPQIASFALENGIDIINDVTGLSNDDMANIISQNGAGCILMHWNKGKKDPDILEDVRIGLSKSLDKALSAGIKQDRIILDIGIGFGKNFDENMLLLKNQALLKKHFDIPFLVGASRKSFIGKVLSIDDPKKRLIGSVIAHYHALLEGADIIRVHDIPQHIDMIKMFKALKK